MKLDRKFFFFLIIGAIPVLLLLGAFLLRPPILLVTDASFDALYGPARAKLKQVETSLRLFRRIIPVLIPDGVGSDIVAFTIEETARSPYLVLLPYRYHAGAARYASAFPDVPVFVLRGHEPAPDAGDAVFVETDARTDFYRAGLCAALLAESQDGEIVVLENGKLDPSWREAFQAGLQEQGFSGQEKYLSVADDYSDIENVVCVVMTGQATSFLEQNLDIPVILFSWVDPALTARAIKVMFDDSPWAFLTKVVHARGKEDGLFPSEMVFPKGRTAERTRLQETQNKMFIESEKYAEN
ncbi:MAG: hypothetical protein LBS86_00675 [Treponema sp.]|jgi:hypothetical protein|nr:hypothetical protein [Treponema sp.]